MTTNQILDFTCIAGMLALTVAAWKFKIASDTFVRVLLEAEIKILDRLIILEPNDGEREGWREMRALAYKMLER